MNLDETTPALPARRRRRKLPVVLATLVLALAVFIVPTVWLKPYSINHFYLRALLELLLENPEMLSSLRLLEPYGLDFHADDLNDYSQAHEEHMRDLVGRQLGILHRYDQDGMSEAERESYDVMDWFLTDIHAGLLRFPFYDYAINQLASVHVSLPHFMITTHQVNNTKDARTFIARVEKFGVAFDQVIAYARAQAERGIVPPRFVLLKVKADAQGFANQGVDGNPLLKHFNSKLDALKDLAAGERGELQAALVAALRDVVLPAYARYLAAVDELIAKSTDDAGVWKLPQGDSYYAYKLRSATTTDMTPDEVHALGLQQVAKIQSEMRAILDANGYKGVAFLPAMKKLYDEPRFLYPNTQDGRQQVLADYQRIIDEISAATERMFHLKPAVAVRVEAVPTFMEATAPQGYYQPAPLDRSEPGKFFANLHDLKTHAKFTMRTLAYHEAVPGHHFQISIAQDLKELPLFRRLIPFNVYAEGWGLYAEALAAEEGFEADPFDRLGYLSAQIFRAARLVVDTGIHAKHWTREQAITYMVETTGMQESEVIVEIERYAVWPGQACGYMVGRLKIAELRERAQGKLGAQFSLPAFHDVVLTSGEVPLTILERRIDRWLAQAPLASP